MAGLKELAGEEFTPNLSRLYADPNAVNFKQFFSRWLSPDLAAFANRQAHCCHHFPVANELTVTHHSHPADESELSDGIFDVIDGDSDVNGSAAAAEDAAEDDGDDGENAFAKDLFARSSHERLEQVVVTESLAQLFEQEPRGCPIGTTLDELEVAEI